MSATTGKLGQWFVVIALTAFTGLCQADDLLEFLAPPDSTDVGIDVDQKVYVRWTRGERPVGGRPVAIETTHGTLSGDSTDTDRRGIAVFTISSDTVGSARITATVDTASATLRLNFVDKTGFAPRTDGIAEFENPNGRMPMMVYTDRLAFRGQPGVGVADVARLAAAENLTQMPPLDDNIFVLGLGGVTDRSKIRARARTLQQSHSSVIAKTGLVAKLVNAPQWLVIPEQLIVRFKPGPTDDEIANILSEFDRGTVSSRENDPRRFLIDIVSSAASDALQQSLIFNAMDASVQYSEPNYILPNWSRAAPTDDDGFKWQWHLENESTYGGMTDADVDAAGAWKYGVGSQNTIIAVIDRGFDVGHPDLAANLWTKSPDQKGIDIIDGDGSDLLSPSTVQVLFAHGTRAAGVAGAVGGNGIGYSGACPSCKLLLIRIEGNLDYADEAIRAAVDEGAKVISNSWGSFGVFNDLNKAVSDAADAGVTVLFAISNDEQDNCVVSDPDTSAHHRAIAVGGVNDYDARSNVAVEAMGYGNCVDVTAPTRGGDQGISTTSVKRLPAGPTSTYWPDFGGTSAATPLVAGVAGLLADLNPGLSPLDIQRALQDTADRVDPANGRYSSESGYSDPGGVSTHAYGRINAAEAARLVAPTTPSGDQFYPGRGGHDLLLRDHALDWGNTEQDSNTIFSSPRQTSSDYRSVDIKIDVDPFQPQATTPEQFEQLTHEEPEVGKRSRVYVRLRNRGAETVPSATLKLIWAIVDDSYPDLPTDFWTAFPASHTDLTHWQPLVAVTTKDVEYSGSSVAGCPGRAVPQCLPLATPPSDLAHIAMYSVAAMDWTPGTHRGPAYFAVVTSADEQAQGMVDPANASLQVLQHVNKDNNVTLWTAGPPDVGLPPPGACNDELVILVKVLLLIAAVLLLIVIWRRLAGLPVFVWAYVMLVITLIVLLFICVSYPGCIDAAIDS